MRSAISLLLVHFEPSWLTPIYRKKLKFCCHESEFVSWPRGAKCSIPIRTSDVVFATRQWVIAACNLHEQYSNDAQLSMKSMAMVVTLPAALHGPDTCSLHQKRTPEKLKKKKSRVERKLFVTVDPTSTFRFHRNEKAERKQALSWNVELNL